MIKTETLAVFCIVLALIVFPCLAMILTGIATPFIEGFAVDASDRLYVGVQEEIRVYDNGELAYVISPQTSKGYAFTITEDDQILLSTSSITYRMSLSGDILEKNEEDSVSLYNELNWGKKQFVSASGDEYRMKSYLGWTRIIKNGEERVYRISVLSFAVKCLLAACMIAILAFPMCVALHNSRKQKRA